MFHDLHWAYRLFYPERLSDATAVIIDAIPITNVQYSEGQSLSKYAAAACRSHAYISFIFTLKHTRGEQPPTGALERGRGAKNEKETEPVL